jgi:hypothetical protein
MCLKETTNVATYPPLEHPGCTRHETVLTQTDRNDVFTVKKIWINAPWIPVKFPAGIIQLAVMLLYM